MVQNISLLVVHGTSCVLCICATSMAGQDRASPGTNSKADQHSTKLPCPPPPPHAAPRSVPALHTHPVFNPVSLRRKCRQKRENQDSFVASVYRKNLSFVNCELREPEPKPQPLTALRSAISPLVTLDPTRFYVDLSVIGPISGAPPSPAHREGP